MFAGFFYCELRAYIARVKYFCVFQFTQKASACINGSY